MMLFIGIVIVALVALLVIVFLVKCKTQGSKCTEDTDCCKSLVCTGGTCQVPCSATASCVQTEQYQNGKWSSQGQPLVFDLRENNTLILSNVSTKTISMFVDTGIPVDTFTIDANSAATHASVQAVAPNGPPFTNISVLQIVFDVVPRDETLTLTFKST